MKVSEILRHAKELIGTPDKWTQGRYARDVNGIGCHISSSHACSFCTVGAVERVIIDKIGPVIQDEYEVVIDILQTCCVYDTITEYNDIEYTTHSDIMGLFSKAIKFAEEIEQNESI